MDSMHSLANCQMPNASQEALTSISETTASFAQATHPEVETSLTEEFDIFVKRSAELCFKATPACTRRQELAGHKVLTSASETSGVCPLPQNLPVNTNSADAQTGGDQANTLTVC